MGDSEVLVRKPIKELLGELDPNRFWQIHRSTIVDTHSIAGVTRGLRDQAGNADGEQEFHAFVQADAGAGISFCAVYLSLEETGKLQHWRGVSAILPLEAAPVLEFR